MGWGKVRNEWQGQEKRPGGWKGQKGDELNVVEPLLAGIYIAPGVNPQK